MGKIGPVTSVPRSAVALIELGVFFPTGGLKFLISECLVLTGDAEIDLFNNNLNHFQVESTCLIWKNLF